MVWSGQYDKLFIGGQWVEPGGSDRIDVISPMTEEVVASVPSATTADVDQAVAAARRSFDDGTWSRAAPDERIATMQRFSDIFRARHETIAELVTQEMGCPITLSRVVQAAVPQAILDAYLELAPQYPFRSVRRATSGSALVVRQPVGVVAAVVPWNVPLSVSMQKVAPALLTGCSLVLKPAPETPLSAYLLAEMLHEAGVPDGVVSIIPADRDVSEYLVTHPGVDKVTFTGSTAAGRRIASLCGERLKRVTLELGGKSAAIILDDADMATTVESLRYGALRNSGQVCSLKTRLVVPRRRREELLDHLDTLLDSMPVGDPMDPTTQIGPMASSRQRDRVQDYIGIGKNEGARIARGGGRPSTLGRGWFIEPTIFAEVDPGMRIAQEEIFGPVLAVIDYETEDEAVLIANNSDYGLNGAVFTSDLEHGLELAQRIRTGTVEINGNSAGLHAPMGGFKASGIGREAGLEGFEAYVELQSLGIPRELADTLA
jgi:aldehyde dehydrogenase (NAD+)